MKNGRIEKGEWGRERMERTACERQSAGKAEKLCEMGGLLTKTEAWSEEVLEEDI